MENYEKLRKKLQKHWFFGFNYNLNHTNPLKRHNHKYIDRDLLKETCSARICLLPFHCLSAHAAEKCGYKHVVFPFVLLFYDTSRSCTKTPNIFSECTRSLLYARGISLRLSDTNIYDRVSLRNLGAKNFERGNFSGSLGRNPLAMNQESIILNLTC